MSTVRALLFACIAAFAAACGPKSTTAPEISNLRIPAAPPSATVLALYGDILLGQDDVLIGISSPDAESVELHETREEDGRMTMRPVPRLEIKAGQKVKLAPGGLHGMLMNPRGPASPDGTVKVTFMFEKRGNVDVLAVVQPPG